MIIENVVYGSINITELNVSLDGAPIDLGALTHAEIIADDTVYSSSVYPSDIYWADGVVFVRFGHFLPVGNYDIELNLYSFASPDPVVVIHPDSPNSALRVQCHD